MSKEPATNTRPHEILEVANVSQSQCFSPILEIPSHSTGNARTAAELGAAKPKTTAKIAHNHGQFAPVQNQTRIGQEFGTSRTQSPASTDSERSMNVNGSGPATPVVASSSGPARSFHQLSIHDHPIQTETRKLSASPTGAKRELALSIEDEPPAKQQRSIRNHKRPGAANVTHEKSSHPKVQPDTTRQRHAHARTAAARQQRPAHDQGADLSAKISPPTLKKPHPSSKAPNRSKQINKPADPPPQHWKPLMQSSSGTEYPGMILQPDSSPISEKQLAAEIRGIYDGLVTVETKCIDIDAALAYDVKSPLGVEQYQALIALHRTLLYEHHDFLMATQHPSASDKLKGLATKNSMPARMWKHGIHAFLEVLRHRRPDSQDYMLAFVVLAYQMTALLYETVPCFTDTWIECLGDLARYRMAIEDEREMHAVWGGVAARWYTLASDRHPDIGRLYHHLGILERPSMRKLASYAKSLTCKIPFFNARDSMATFCRPIVQEEHLSKANVGSAEALSVTFFALVFLSEGTDSIQSTASSALQALAGQPSAKTKEYGPQLVLASIASVFEFGSANNNLWESFVNVTNEEHRSHRPSEAALPGSTNNTETLSVATTSAMPEVVEFFFACFNTLTRPQATAQRNSDVLASVHVILAWFYSLHLLGSKSRHQSVRDTIGLLMDANRFSWGGLCQFLNGLCHDKPIDESVFESARQSSFPKPRGNEKFIPLAEDYWMRGLLWAQLYLPKDLLPARADEIESPLSGGARLQRVQWLALSLAFRTSQIKWDVHKRAFFAPVLGPPANAQVNRIDSLASTVGQTDFAPTSRSTTWAAHSSAPTSPTSTSRSSTTVSMAEDSDGYTMVPLRRKSKPANSWAHIAAAPPRKTRPDNQTVRVADADECVQ